MHLEVCSSNKKKCSVPCVGNHFAGRNGCQDTSYAGENHSPIFRERYKNYCVTWYLGTEATQENDTPRFLIFLEASRTDNREQILSPGLAFPRKCDS